MTSSTNFAWRPPIAVKPDDLGRIEQLVRAFAVVAIQRVVASEGLNAEEFKTSEDAIKTFDESREYKFDALSREIGKFEVVTWSVQLANGIRRSDLTLGDLLGLPNVNDSSIVEIDMSCGNYEHKIEISISNELNGRSCFIRLKGEYNDVYSFKEEVSQLLASCTRNWAIVTKGWFGVVTSLAAISAFALAVMIAVIQVGLARDWSSDVAARWLTTAFVVIPVSWIFLGVFITRRWESVFPRVEFQFGGGINASEARRNWRKVVWSVPVLVVGMPILTNLISSAIAG